MTQQIDWPSVTIIVLNYNGRFLLKPCLDALLAIDYPHSEIILVDNASSDDSLDFMQTHFPTVKLIANQENRGFAAGNNSALRACQTEFAVLVNPDIVVTTNWLKQLIHPMLADDNIGIAGCKLLYPDGKTIQHAGGIITMPQAIPDHFGVRELDSGQFDTQKDVDYVIGAALAIRRETLATIGLLDEGFFLYYEDSDWCTRAQRAGYRVVYVPTAVAIHDESAIAGQGSPTYQRRFHSSRWRYLLKHTSAETLLHATLPAEMEWLSQRDPSLQRRLATVYRQTLFALPEIWQTRVAGGATAVAPPDQQIITHNLLDLYTRAMQAFQANTDFSQLARAATVEERPFSSTTPLIGPILVKLRTLWLNMAARWYIRPLTTQQNSFNHALITELRETAVAFNRRGQILLAQESDQIYLQQQQADLHAELAQLEENLNDIAIRLQRLHATI